MTRVAFALAGLACVLALAGCGDSNGISLPCNAQPQGAICVKVYNDHLQVQDVIAYLSATDSPLPGKSWRFLLTAGGRTYPGVAHHGTPPI